MLLVVSKVKKLTNQEEFGIEKIIKRKGDKLYVNGKAMIIQLITGLIKKILYKISQYFPKPYEPFEGDINVKVNLSNYATKTDLKLKYITKIYTN